MSYDTPAKQERKVKTDMAKKGSDIESRNSIMNEYEALRQVVTNLHNEKKEIERQLNETDLGKLRIRVERLENEVQTYIEQNKALATQFSSVEEQNHTYAQQFAHMEEENSNLINLYVASLQLHSSLNYEEVITILKEIIINMVGSEDFGIFLKNPETDTLQLVSHFGLSESRLAEIKSGNSKHHTKINTDTLHVKDLNEDQENSSDNAPVALIPMHADGIQYGVIAIYTLLLQKKGFTKLDMNLFDMLGNHAATALNSARLHALHKDDTNSMSTFVKLMQELPEPVELDDPLKNLHETNSTLTVTD